MAFLQKHPTPDRKSGDLWKWTRHPRVRKLFSMCRWIHVVLSTFLLVLFLFFCVTGLFLNHPEWFSHQKPVQTQTFSLKDTPTEEYLKESSVNLEDLQSWIAAETGLKSPRKVTAELDLGEWSFDYPLPAGYAFVIISQEDQTMTVEYQKGTFLAVLNDLHKGRHTGKAWSYVLNISTILLSFMALTGLIILFQQAKWRLQGLALMGAGLLIPVVIFFYWVPNYS